MRGRILTPILVMLVAFCVVLGFAVYSNVSNTTSDLIDHQLNNSLDNVEKRILGLQSQSYIQPSDYQSLVEGLGVSDGGVLIINSNGEIVADSQQIMNGKNVSSQDWYKTAQAALNNEFTAVYGQTEIYAHSVSLGEYVLVSYISSDVMNEYFLTPLYVIGVVGIASVVILGILMYFLITRLAIHPIESLDEQMSDLDTLEAIDLQPLKYCPEIVAPAQQINKLLKARRQVFDSGNASFDRNDAVLSNQTVIPGFTQDPDTPAVIPGFTQDSDTPAVIPGLTRDPYEEPAATHTGLPIESALTEERASSIPAHSTPSQSMPSYERQLEGATEFESVNLLREVFEQHKQTVLNKQLKFSLMVDKDMPTNIYANRGLVAAALSQMFSKTFDEVKAGEKVEARVSFADQGFDSDPQFARGDESAICFEIYSNDLKKQLLLAAKRGM